MTKRQKFKKEYAVELFKIAKSDLDSARLLHGTKKARPETTVFHVQQCIEKSIKAVICHNEIPLLMVHDIGALLGCLPDEKHPPYDYDLMKFNDFAEIFRYEEGKAIIDAADVEQAILVGQNVVDWAEAALGTTKK